MDTTRIGVIGLGRMGQHHCRVCSGIKDISLIGLYDINQQLSQETAARYGTIAFHKVEDLINCADAVIIATPTSSHYELAVACVDQKVHALIEKPVTENIHEAEFLARSSQDTGTIIQVGHIERFNPAYLELKKILEQLSVIAINFRRLSPYRVSNTDVNVVLDLMVHDLDLCNDLTKREPVEISAFGMSPFSSSLDHVVAQLFYGSNPLVTLTASRVTEQKIRSIDVTAEDAYIEADFMNKSICIHRGSIGEFLGKNQSEVSYRQESIIERILVPNVEPLFAEIRSFIDCINSKSVPKVSILDGLAALYLAQRIINLSTARFDQKYPQISIPSLKEVFTQ